MKYYNEHVKAYYQYMLGLSSLKNDYKMWIKYHFKYERECL